MSTAYLELRRRLEDRDRGLREKVMGLKEAVGIVRDGDHVALGGCTFSRTPFALVWELIRQRKKGITISRNIISTEGDLLLMGGVSRRFITSWFSQGIVWGVSRVMRHFVESKEATFEEWSHLSLGMMYRAGAMGLPFLPTRVMLGSDLAKRVRGLKEMTCPYTGERLALIPALNPDVAFIHVQRCDPFGNAQYDGLPFMDQDIALAADQVILTTERVVTNDQIRRTPDQTKIPFFCVEAVVEVPFGSIPHECWGHYEPLYRHMDMYAELTRTKGLEGAREYLDRFVYEPEDFQDFLNRVGLREILQAASDGKRIYND